MNAWQSSPVALATCSCAPIPPSTTICFNEAEFQHTWVIIGRWAAGGSLPQAWDGLSNVFVMLAERHLGKLTAGERDWLKALKIPASGKFGREISSWNG